MRAIESHKSNMVSGNSRPLMTFALIAYNQENFVEEAISGALSQTYQPLQIVLSDDGSTDRTFELMKRAAQEYSGPHDVVVNQNEENRGIGAHINRNNDIVSWGVCSNCSR